MSRKGLFVPGLFATPTSQKFAALKQAVNPYELQIVDFSQLYREEFCYADFVEWLAVCAKKTDPDFIIGYSFGCQLYASGISAGKLDPLPTAALIVPLGDYAKSRNGHDILTGRKDPAEIYRPINELKIATKARPEFFSELSMAAQRDRQTTFTGNLLSISASEDDDTDPDVFEALKDQGFRARRTLLSDTHRLPQTMGSVCGIMRNFILTNA